MQFDIEKTAEIIKKLRKEAKLTQEQVANDMGINLKTYQSLEQGKRAGMIDTLCIVAEYYGVSIDYLVYGTMMGNEMDKLLSGLSLENKRKIFKIVESMITTLEM